MICILRFLPPAIACGVVQAFPRLVALKPVGVKLVKPSQPDITVHASKGSLGGLDMPESPISVDRSKGLWTRCDKCGVILYIKHLKEHNHICFGCNHHMKMSSLERVNSMIDAGTWREFDETLSPIDPLEFTDQKAYTDRIKIAQKATGLQDGVRTGTGLLHGIPVALGVMDFSYMGGSMGSVVGEKLTRLIEHATQEGLALMIVCTSGGARMQEGILSLMQMAKISGALHVHQNSAKLLYIAILASPTTGGVTASFGMLGDIIIAEPQAIIGFAGRRVIEQTLQEQLPEDFQTAEYLLDKGLLDLVVPRTFLKGALYELMDFYKNAPQRAQGSIPFGVQHGMYMATEEKIRRKWKQWGGGGEAQVEDGAKPSYKELVSSLEGLVGSGNEINLQDLMKDEESLTAALGVAKDSKVSWVEQQSKILQKDKNYTIMTSKQ
eukprot:gene32549-17266_t